MSFEIRKRTVFLLLSLIIPAIIVLVSLQAIHTVIGIIKFIDTIAIIFSFFSLRIIPFFGDSLSAVSLRLDTGFGTMRLKRSMRPSTDGLALDVSEQRECRLEVVPYTRMISVAEVEIALMGLEEETSGPLAPSTGTRCPSSFSTRGHDGLPQRTAYRHLYIGTLINVLVAEALYTFRSLTTGASP